jgi:hypothetical protein
VTISTFVNDRKAETGINNGRGLKRDYKAKKRQDAKDREAVSAHEKVGRRLREGDADDRSGRELLTNLFGLIDGGNQYERL